ncbi:MAG: hypothetical protein AAF488_07670 [Planctomycetota bacterium]
MGTALNGWIRPAAWVVLIATVLTATPGLAQPDVRVVRTIWGFSGGGIVNEYQPVSILIENRGNEVFAGPLEFIQVELTQRIGLPQVSGPAPLAPGGQRWLQFMARPREWDAFELKTGLLTSEEIPFVSFDAPRRAVRVRDEAEGVARRGSRADFPARLLPRSVVAYVTLDHLVIDQAPELDSLQQAAVRDFVYDGGVLHLFSDGNGGYPELPGKLADLSPGRSGAPKGPMAFGAGWVMLHSDVGLDVDILDVASRWRTALATPPRMTLNDDTRHFEQLAEITMPHHQFGWIYGLTALLFLIIGPLNFWIARRVRNYGLALLVTVGAVVGFSAAFFWIGKAGQRGLAGRYVATYARALEGGYRFRQLDHLFVARGGRYDFRPQAAAAYHQLGLDRREKVDGLIYSGVGGQISLNMPLYSSRQVIAESTVRQPWIIAPPKLGAEVLTVPEVEGREILWIRRSSTNLTEHFRADGADRWILATGGEIDDGRWDRPFPQREYGSEEHRRTVFERFAAETVEGIRGANREHIYVFARERGAVPTQSTLEVAEQYILYHHIVTEDRPR